MAGFTVNNIGLFGSSSGSSGDWMGNLLSMTSDYNSIRSGSYSKLLKAYYGKDSSSNNKSTVSKNEQLREQIKKTEADKTVVAAKSDADDLKKSADALVTTGSKSLFVEKEIETTDEETGEKVTTMGYDRKAITSAIKSFVDNYNSTIDSASDVDNTRILQKTLGMTQTTNSNSKLLAKVGITIEKGNKLKVDEEKLNNADISTIKTLFNGRNSYADQIGFKAGQISSAAVSASLNSSLYTSGASYNKNSYNSLFDYGI